MGKNEVNNLTLSQPLVAQPIELPHHRYAYLDGWRGLSIIAVLIGHFMHPPGINVGRLGVEMFFVLSGRLMAEILFVRHTQLPLFFRRRIARVWPALFVFVIALWTIAITLPGKLNVPTEIAATALTFTYNYVRGYPMVDHIWSLCVEEHIYILLGLIAYTSRRYGFDAVKTIGFMAGAFMLNGIIQTLYLGHAYYEVYWRSDVRGASILISVATYLWLNKSGIQVARWVPVVFAILGVLLSVNKVPDVVKYSVGSICLAIAINTISHLPKRISQLLNHPVLIAAGMISFSLYLWQQPFYQLINHRPLWQLLPAALILATISYYAIEVPARRSLNRYWDRSRTRD